MTEILTINQTVVIIVAIIGRHITMAQNNITRIIESHIIENDTVIAYMTTILRLFSAIVSVCLGLILVLHIFLIIIVVSLQ